MVKTTEVYGNKYHIDEVASSLGKSSALVPLADPGSDLAYKRRKQKSQTSFAIPSLGFIKGLTPFLPNKRGVVLLMAAPLFGLVYTELVLAVLTSLLILSFATILIGPEMIVRSAWRAVASSPDQQGKSLHHV